jgi:hypothetical protein
MIKVIGKLSFSAFAAICGVSKREREMDFDFFFLFLAFSFTKW